MDNVRPIRSEETSFAVSLRRFLEGMSSLQVEQYRVGTAAALGALERFLASPAAQGMHPLIARQFDLERARAHKLLLHLAPFIRTQRNIAMGTPNNPKLAQIQKLIEGKSPQEILRVRDELKREQREPEWVAYLDARLAELDVA